MAPLKDRYCFVHLPKAAGTSLLYYLRDVAGVANVLHAPSIQEQQQAPLEQLLHRYQILVGHYEMSTLPKWIFECVFMFTFMRDPIDRVISLYDFYRNVEHPDLLPEIARAQSMPLAPLLRETDLSRPSVWSNWQTYVLSGMSPTSFAPRKLLAPAQENLRRFDFVGFYENLADDVRQLAELCDWNTSVRLPALNVTPSRKRRDELDAETLAAIAELNQDDLALYEFARTLPRKTERPRCFGATGRYAEMAPVFPVRSEHGTKEIVIESVTVRGRQSGSDAIEQGEVFEIAITGASAIDCANLVAGIRINDSRGVEIYGINTMLLSGPASVRAGEKFSVSFTCVANLADEPHYLTVAFHDADGRNFHWVKNHLPFTCVRAADSKFRGRLDLRAEVETSFSRATPAVVAAIPQTSPDLEFHSDQASA